MKSLILVASCLLLAGPALAEGSPNEPAASTPSAQTSSTPANEDDRVVCRRIQADTGSRLGGRRVCMTKRDWREYERQN